MKLLLSGSSGLLGCALTKQAKDFGVTYRALDRTCVPLSLQSSAATIVDSYFDGVDHFIHAAANTNVEFCEANPAMCYRDNVLFTELLASAARRRGVGMTFISSTGVYGSNQKKPWAEYDEANPITHHHRSKLLGERTVMAADRSNLVIRTGWLFGGNANAAKNFVAKRIHEARESKERIIFSNHQQFGCPTNVDDLAAQVILLIKLRASGVFNAVNAGFASRFEYVTEIVRLAGLAVEVCPVVASNFKRIAPVSNNETAVNWRADSLGLPPMRSWQEALADYLSKNKLLLTDL
jgi:dTDP-4-dehydrorhamnose reductase